MATTTPVKCSHKFWHSNRVGMVQCSRNALASGRCRQHGGRTFEALRTQYRFHAAEDGPNGSEA